MAKYISIRLQDEEFNHLMRQPGHSKSDKMRALLHQKTVSEEIAGQVVDRIGSRLEAIEGAIQRQADTYTTQINDLIARYESERGEQQELMQKMRDAFNLLVAEVDKLRKKGGQGA